MASHRNHSPFAASAEDRIDALGEIALLARIRTWLGDASPPAPQGIGDDCAVWPKPPAGGQLLFTTDAVVYGRHFDADCPPQLAAAKLLKRNLSDIAAMGGTPHSALLALTLPRNLSLCWLEAFYLGLRECSLHYATPVTGGDITEGTDNFFAAHLTLIGHASRPLLRTGAQMGDHLFVTGALGGSLRGHHLHFEPRLPEGRWLAAQPDVRALIDLTDGLAKDLPELLPDGSASNVHVASHVVVRPAEAEAASPRVVVRLPHAQTKGQSGPLVGGQAEAGALHSTQEANMPRSTQEGATPMSPTAVALLDLAALPLTEAAWLEATAQPPGQSDLAPQICAALYDGEDYELLFAVDGQTDPADFIARWQQHFNQTEAPAPGTPTRTQAAYPYCIGTIALAPNHPVGACRLYDGASNQPLASAQGGFEHLKTG